MIPAPAISVVLPVYNGEAFVREAIESILAQTFTDFELIVINDGATDGSGAIIRELAERDPRILNVERPNGGLVSALNDGIARARAPLVARMDADDVAMPQRLAVQHARMADQPRLGVLGSFIQLMNRDGNILRLGDYPVSAAETERFMEHGCPVAHPTVLLRREAVLAAGGYRKAFSHAEDYDLWLRIHELGYAIENIPSPLLNYRIHGANVSTVHRQAQELGSTVALLAHRARRAGLPDPTAELASFDARIIDAFPAHLRQDMDARVFVLRHANLSLGTPDELRKAWRDYRALSAGIRAHPILCDFLMRLMNGSLRARILYVAAAALISALWMHPLLTIRIILRELIRGSMALMLMRQSN